MDTQSNFTDDVSMSSGHVLITEVPDDESVQTMTHSDVRSEGGGTLYSHKIDSPIPEESEEDMEGRFSRKTEPTFLTQGREQDFDLNGRSSRQSDLTTGQSLPDDGASDLYDEEDEDDDEDEEDEESYPDSMSMDNMDNVSDTFSVIYEPQELKDEDFDTDLEMDDDKWLHPEKYDHDTTGLTKYLTACEDNDVTPIRYFIKHMLEESMNLGHHGLGPAAMKALSVPLESNTSIERLDLEGNWIEDDGVLHLCRVLRENVYIVHLNLAENKIGNNGALYLVNLLNENRTIEWLDLTGNCITDNIAELLCEMMKKNTTLRHLKLSHNELGERGAQWLKDALMDNDSLETLDISWNHFQTRGCSLIADGLRENVGLKEINLCMNGFGLDGAIGLGEAIKVNRTLMKMDASYCRLPLEGAASLANSLQVNENLQELNVGYNSLGPEGTFALLVGMERNECSGMTLLNLGNTKVTPQFKKLQDRLESERPLRVHHGGVMLETLRKEAQLDPWEAFKRDPMTKLKEWVEKAGYRLIDLLRHFDKDNSMTISREEFINGIKSVRIEITDEQIDILLDRLDTDGDGEIDFRPWFTEGELVEGDNEHRSLKREIRRTEEEQRLGEDATQTSLDAFLRQSPAVD